ncbi:MAG: hypothetical protein ABSG73_03705 [Candidatus Aminicenantales bacterium]|jgi:hypothetical protein
MARLKKPGRSGAALMAALAGLLWLSSVSCKSSTSSSTTGTITVTNSCGATIIVYLDGTSRATIETGSSDTIESVTIGSHLLEAKKSDTGVLINSRTLTVTTSGVSVTIGGAASLRVTNQYGEILRIYLDASYLGDIGDQITQTIPYITFASHVFTAETKTSTTVVATITIDVTDVTQYTWTITK